MREREIDRRRERERTQAAALAGHTHAVLALQRSAGNHAVAQVLARAPATSGTVQIHGVGDIKVKGGNLEEWAGSGSPETVELTSHKGRHSGRLEKLSAERTKTDVKVSIAPANQAGQELSVGGGTVLEIKGARVGDHAVADGVETWRLLDFTNVHRTKVSHRVA
jgi:hypothetical protein